MGRRGPGTGLRQAASVAEAEQWQRLLAALGSPHVEPLLPRLALRVSDQPALRRACPRAAASLRGILSETHDLAAVNAVLAGLYADLESGHGARLARAVFAVADHGFPRDGDVALMARWDAPLRALLRSYASVGLPESKRDAVLGVVGHHLAEQDALCSSVRAGDDADLGWLLTLLQWRRFASLRRALARVLNAAEREQLAAVARAAPLRQGAARGVHRAG